MTDMKLAEHYLSIEISQQPDKITLSQSDFTTEILKHFSMQDSKPVSTSMKHKAQLDLEITGESLNKEGKE
jgi:hypothetical protein